MHTERPKQFSLLSRRRAQRLYMITVPGLHVTSDWRIVHDRLLDDFPQLVDVLPTTTPATLLIVYRGRAEIDAWLEALSTAVLYRRMHGCGTPVPASPGRRLTHQRETRKAFPHD